MKTAPFVQNGISFALSLFVTILILDLDPTPAGKCHSFKENYNLNTQNISNTYFALKQKEIRKRPSFFFHYFGTVRKLFNKKLKVTPKAKITQDFITLSRICTWDLLTLYNTWMMGFEILIWMLWNDSFTMGFHSNNCNHIYLLFYWRTLT